MLTKGKTNMKNLDKLNLIWAQTYTGIIGVNHTLPFQLPLDMKRFKEITMGHVVLMGRLTWLSLPAQYRPLPGRDNYVLSRYLDFKAPGAVVINNWRDTFSLLQTLEDKKLFVIGGGELYNIFINYAYEVYVTMVNKEIPVNEHDKITYAPDIIARLNSKEFVMTNPPLTLEDNGFQTQYAHLLRYNRVDIPISRMS